MAVDKKVTELPVLPSNPVTTDIFLAVRGDTDYQLTGTQLIAFISAVLAVGSVVTFSADTPPNTSGKNGDVVIKPATGQFYQKVAGTWILQYTVPAGVVGSQIRYGSGTPNNSTGINGDTYINTDSGIFYLKTGGAYVQQFSMASGPAGATGPAGANGTNGTNGNTILNGSTPPSNSIGVNGDFYINPFSQYIYGPKASGAWPAGVSYAGNGPSFKQAYPYSVSDVRFVYDSVNYTLTFNLNGSDKLLFPYNAVNGILEAKLQIILSSTQFKTKYSFEPIITNDGTNYTSVLFEGVTDDLTTIQIYLS